jgi:hypothetical protein
MGIGNGNEAAFDMGCSAAVQQFDLPALLQNVVAQYVSSTALARCYVQG